MKAFVVVILLLSFSSMGQNVCFKGGVNFSNIAFIEGAYNGTNNSYRWLPGFNAGIAYEQLFGNVFSLRGSFDINRKGYRKVTSYGGNFPSIVTENKLTYVDLPFICRANLNDDKNRFYVGLGGYIGMGIASNVAWGEENSYRRIDTGLNAQVGFEIRSVFLELTYSHGLLNSLTTNTYNNKMYNRLLSITTGVQISKANTK